ncbi:MAG: hypothetical protein P8N52_07145 [Crocinitomicaceae bacterium]|nr:hypothetical protein [Crocinitomicaceae bacterium]MDG1777455.1 hypothetical protein [Crocinitomicaceae bacterium]
MLQLALIIIPAGAVLMTAILFMRKQGQTDLRAVQLELKKERQSFFLPNRMDAYQRAILLMERIHPNSLVMRHNNPGLPASALQVTLLESIRSEYEHNMAQQLFISKETWDLVQKAKDETTRIVHLAGQQMEATSLGMDLSSKIFEIVAEVGVLPTEIAVDRLKKEFQELF